MNELSSLLKRSFEGLGFLQADYEDAATAIVWLESRGMGGLDTLRSAWPGLASNVDSAVEVAAPATSTQVLNAHGKSTLICGRATVDLAMACTSENDVGRVELRHCHECHAILPSLCFCADCGLAAIAYWRGENCLHVAMIAADQCAPHYYQVGAGAADSSAADTLNIACCQDSAVIEQIASRLVGGDISQLAAKRILASEFEAHFEHTLEHGIPIDADLATTLSDAAAAVLVEATEQSRLGAGESAQ